MFTSQIFQVYFEDVHVYYDEHSVDSEGAWFLDSLSYSIDENPIATGQVFSSCQINAKVPRS